MMDQSEKNYSHVIANRTGKELKKLLTVLGEAMLLHLALSFEGEFRTSGYNSIAPRITTIITSRRMPIIHSGYNRPFYLKSINKQTQRRCLDNKYTT